MILKNDSKNAFRSGCFIGKSLRKRLRFNIAFTTMRNGCQEEKEEMWMFYDYVSS